MFAVELSEKAKLIVQDCVIETDLEILIPETYVNNTSERLQLYSRLDNIKNDEALTKFEDELIDRFGPVPPSVKELINSVRMRWLGEKLGFEKLSIKNDKLRAYFISTKETYFSSDTFGKILAFVKEHPKRCKMKDQQGKAMLNIESVLSIDDGIELLMQMGGQAMSSSREISSR